MSHGGKLDWIVRDQEFDFDELDQSRTYVLLMEVEDVKVGYMLVKRTIKFLKVSSLMKY